MINAVLSKIALSTFTSYDFLISSSALPNCCHLFKRVTFVCSRSCPCFVVREIPMTLLPSSPSSPLVSFHSWTSGAPVRVVAVFSSPCPCCFLAPCCLADDWRQQQPRGWDADGSRGEGRRTVRFLCCCCCCCGCCCYYYYCSWCYF